MIFLTVGSQMPFDRLVQAVDHWAGARGSATDVVAQIGQSDFRPAHLRHCMTMSPAEFRRACRSADFLVAHAGMGSVLTALDLGKPLVVMPRRGDLKETRNDHQLATARWLQSRPGIRVAWTETDLASVLDELCVDGGAECPSPGAADPRLIDVLHGFISASSGSR